jgi:hypothetical protein
VQFNARWAQRAKYMQGLFNLQHNTGRTMIEPCACMDMYEWQSIWVSLALEKLGHNNGILHQGTFGKHEKDLDLQSLYCCPSEAERRMNHTHTRLDLE